MVVLFQIRIHSVKTQSVLFTRANFLEKRIPSTCVNFLELKMWDPSNRVNYLDVNIKCLKIVEIDILGNVTY